MESSVEHVACDFLSEPAEFGKVIRVKNKNADAIFFYSYLLPRPCFGSTARVRESDGMLFDQGGKFQHRFGYCYSGRIIRATNNAQMNLFYGLVCSQQFKHI